MINLIQTHAAGGDACAPYDVKFDKQYTIGELIEEVLTRFNNEWGEFEIRHNGAGYFDTFFRVDYKYGKLLGEVPENIANLPIISATSYGGWSAMSYNIIVK